MNGNQIRKIREKLDLDQLLFSRLLGVHMSTVYRWEQMKKDTPKIDILQRQLLEFAKSTSPGSRLVALKEAVLRDPLAGLRELLSWG